MVFKNPTFNSLPAHRTILHLQRAPHTNVPKVKKKKEANLESEATVERPWFGKNMPC